MDSFQIFIMPFIIAALFVFIAYCVGSFFLLQTNLSKFKKSETVFFKFLSGLIILVSLYSIYKTKGASVNAILLVLAVAFYLYTYFNKANSVIKNSIFDKTEMKSLTWLIAFCFIWVIYFIGFDWEAKHVWGDTISYYSDYTFYTDIVQSLVDNGQENYYIFLNKFDTKFNGITSYHFFHFWLAAFVKQYFAISTINAMMYVAFPILFGTTSYMVYTILIKFKLHVVIAFIGALFILICKGFILGDKFHYYYLTQSPMAHPKLIDYYLFASISFFLIISSLEKYKWFPLFVLVVFSYVALPVVVMALGIESFYWLVTKKWKQKKYNMLLNWGVLFFLIVSQLALFKIFAPAFKYNAYQVKLDKETLLNICNYVPSFLIEVSILFSVFIVFFGLVYFVFPNLKKRLPLVVKELTPFIVFLTIAGFVGSSFLCCDVNGWQVFLNTSLPIVLIGVFIVVLAMFSHSKWQATFALGVFVVITLFSIKFNPFPLANACFYHSGNKYSKQYVTTIQNNIKPNWKGGFLCDSNAYIGKFQNSPIIKFMALPLAELNTSPILFSLNSYKLYKADKFKREMYLKLSLFMEFVKQQEEKHEFVSYDNSQLEFVKLHHLQFIITSKDITLPASIDSLYVICSHDKASNETLYIEKTIK
ncbi:MAG: hypothetical protein RJA07_57 [Bacteroidota bacterium]|jgi:hypothetical protein